MNVHIYTGRAKKVATYNVMLIVHLRFKLLLYYFAQMLNVNINVNLQSYISVRLILSELL